MKNKSNLDCHALSEVFCSQLGRLHLLASILTGSSEAASECIVEAFESLHDSFLVSREFAYETARLATIKHGLRKVMKEIRHYALSDTTDHITVCTIRMRVPNLGTTCADCFLVSIQQLNAFDRAVLLLRVYEQYRPHVVALWLRLPSPLIERRKVHAISSLTSLIHGRDTSAPSSRFSPELGMTLSNSYNTSRQIHS